MTLYFYVRDDSVVFIDIVCFIIIFQMFLFSEHLDIYLLNLVVDVK